MVSSKTWILELPQSATTTTLALASTLMIAHLDLNLSDNLFKQQLGRINLSQSCYSKLKGLYDGRRGLRVCVFIPRFPPEGPNFGWAVWCLCLWCREAWQSGCVRHVRRGILWSAPKATDVVWFFPSWEGRLIHGWDFWNPDATLAVAEAQGDILWPNDLSTIRGDFEDISALLKRLPLVVESPATDLAVAEATSR